MVKFHSQVSSLIWSAVAGQRKEREGKKGGEESEGWCGAVKTLAWEFSHNKERMEPVW